MVADGGMPVVVGNLELIPSASCTLNPPTPFGNSDRPFLSGFPQGTTTRSTASQNNSKFTFLLFSRTNNSTLSQPRHPQLIRLRILFVAKSGLRNASPFLPPSPFDNGKIPQVKIKASLQGEKT